MNNLDFKPIKNIDYSFIFKEQKKIMLQYEKIDLENFDINVYEDQELFKNFLGLRFIEEITESSEEIEHYVHHMDKLDDERCAHFLEEMVDAFNFLLEAYIIYGWNEKNLICNKNYPNFLSFRLQDSPFERVNTTRFVKSRLFDIISEAGLVCNCLKVRPWRQTQYLVDLMVFESRFKKLWETFHENTCAIGISNATLLDTWSLKYQCNKFRIESSY